MKPSVGQSARPGKSHFAASQKICGYEDGLQKALSPPQRRAAFFGREAEAVKLYSKLFRAITPKAAFPGRGQRRSGAASGGGSKKSQPNSGFS